MLGHFRKAQVPPKRIVREFPVTPDAHVPVGESCSILDQEVQANQFTFKVQHYRPSILFRDNLLMSLQIRAFFLLSICVRPNLLLGLEKVFKVA